MKVFNEDKTVELTDYDLEKGYLKPDKRFVAHHDAIEAVKEVGHYETEKEYPNGGKLVKWVIDVPGVEARESYNEYEDIYVYIPYTEKELAEIEIEKLKRELSRTDYQAIKYAEGILSEAEYADIRSQRQAWRDKINELEDKLK